MTRRGPFPAKLACGPYDFVQPDIPIYIYISEKNWTDRVSLNARMALHRFHDCHRQI